LDKNEASKIIVRRGWLSHTPTSFRRAVLDRCLLEQFKTGTPIYSVGDKPGGMFGIVSGGLGVSLAPGEAGPYTAHFAMPGSWFGQGPAFTRQLRIAGLTATRDSELMHLPLWAIDEIVKRDPAAWRFFGLLTLDHLNTSMRGADDLMIRNHEKRFVAVLLRVGGFHNIGPRENHQIEIDINQQDLAHMANVAQTTAGAILRKLEAKGYLALAYRRISILAPNELRKMLSD
jgi:CRP/FNR family transcriptional regulator, cyclic AMP receptor protein